MSTTTEKTAPGTPERLMQFAWGYSIPLMVEAGIKNRVFDVLAAGPKTLDELADTTKATRRGLRILCDALASIDLLRKQGNRYALSPESDAFLVSTKPSFQGGIFKHVSTQLIPRWLKLEQIVRDGRPAAAVNQEGDGSAFFEQFVEDIFPMSYHAAVALGQALNLGVAKEPYRVLDLAAGSGVWGIGVAQQSPQVRVTAVDWPAVIPVTRRVAQRFGLLDRFSFVEGDLHEASFGTGHHLATLGHILHSEGEQRSRQLLKRTFASLRPGGTIAISEFTPNEDRTGPANTLIFAVNMLVNTDVGDAFTFNEIRTWLTEAGFRDVRQLEAPAPSPLILANKPS